MKLSIVVPAFNETKRILPSIDRILAYMDGRGDTFELLVVDDGSDDGTAELVQERYAGDERLRVLRYTPNRGKGYAVRFGMTHAVGELILLTDADLSTPIEELEKLQAAVDAGQDIVIGSRAHRDAEIRERQPLFREAGGKLFNLLVRLLVLPDLRDTQCGFKLFRRSSVEPVLPTLIIDGFAFDVEILALARARGAKIAEAPVIWVNKLASRVRMAAAARAYVDLIGIRRRARALTATTARN